jgi:hypothetical protein
VEPDYLLEDQNEFNIMEVLKLSEESILKKEYMGYIERSFESHHPTLYLNNYKFVLGYLQDEIDGPDAKIRGKKETLFRLNAIHVYNLELESTEIRKLQPVLGQFMNLKEINLSYNYILSL